MKIKNKIISLLSVIMLILITAIIAVLGLPCLVLPRKYTAKLINFWSKMMLSFFKNFDGLDWVVEGTDNIPKGPFVLASKHQSVWDTIFFTAFFTDAAMVLKRVIIMIPFYGLHAIKAKMIWLDRKGHSKALKKLIKQGKNCKKANRPIVRRSVTKDRKNFKSEREEIISVTIINLKAISPKLSINFSIGFTPKFPINNK